MSARFSMLEARLLRGGVAPTARAALSARTERPSLRHCRRTERVRAAYADTSCSNPAPHWARTMNLPDAMLRQRDFRSLSARVPGLVFGALPVLSLPLVMPWHIPALAVLTQLSRTSSVRLARRAGAFHRQFSTGSRHCLPVCADCTPATHFSHMAGPQHTHRADPFAPLGQSGGCRCLPPWLQRVPSAVWLLRRNVPQWVHAASPECLVELDRDAMGDLGFAISADPSPLVWLVRRHRKWSHYLKREGATTHGRSRAGVLVTRSRQLLRPSVER